MYALNSMRRLSDVENKELYRRFKGVDLLRRFIRLAPVVQTSDSAIHRINHYPADSVIDFRNT